MKYEIQRQSFRKGYGGFWYDNTGDYFIDSFRTLEEAVEVAKWYAEQSSKGLLNSNIYVWKMDANDEPAQLLYEYEPFKKSNRPDAADEAYSCNREISLEGDEV